MILIEIQIILKFFDIFNLSFHHFNKLIYKIKHIFIKLKIEYSIFI